MKRFLFVMVALAGCKASPPNSSEARSTPVDRAAPTALIERIAKGESKAFPVDAKAYAGVDWSSLPIGVFDSGVGGLTVLNALRELDEFDNTTHRPGKDGIFDFKDERFVYFGDQANMPYGRYASEGKEDFLRELIVEDAAFLVGQRYWPSLTAAAPRSDKTMVKAVVVACNTATAYGIADLRRAFDAWKIPVVLVGVVEAGAEGAVKAHPGDGAVAVMATVGTCKSNAYPKTIARFAEAAGVKAPVVVQQGSVGLAGAIEGDRSFIGGKSTYQGPAVQNASAPIDPALASQYAFDPGGLVGDPHAPESWQLASVENYVRYDVTSLVESYRKENRSAPIRTVVLGCTHFPLQRERIAAAFERLRTFRDGSGTRPYEKVIDPKIQLVDPAKLTASQLYRSLAEKGRLRPADKPLVLERDSFYISKPNPTAGAALTPEGSFEVGYKYGRVAGDFERETVRRVPMRESDLTPELRQLLARDMPLVWKGIRESQIRSLSELERDALAAKPPEPEPGRRASDLVELVSLEPEIKLDIRYATANNFVGMTIYREGRAFMQRPAAEALVRAHRALAASGYGLLVHDAYRPWYVTKMFWDATPVDKHDFVADPAKGSRHNRGCAVDVTLYERSSGTPVVMPSLYDEMSERAFADYPGGTPEERRLRGLLRSALEAQGFVVYDKEWWHFDFRDWKLYAVENLTFDQLAAHRGVDP